MNNNTLQQLLDVIWEDYVATNPAAQKIHDLFTGLGENVINDHIAFRTYDHPKVNIDVLSKPFEDRGYKAMGAYNFETKKLFARHYEHDDPEMPLIFISQLRTREFDDDIQDFIASLVGQVPEDFAKDPAFLCQGRLWDLKYPDYLILKEVSEYAAWMSAYGFRANHFTVSINHLRNFSGIQEVNQFLKDNGFELNASGGEVKGSPEDLLEQSSTIAHNKEVEFLDGRYVIPGCYYEFAKRYKKSNGELFRGFVAGSADKIFESTNKGQDFSK